MADLLQWLTDNPIVIVLVSVIIFAIVLMYLVAFLQGREVSFWPAKIGIKPDTKPAITNPKSILLDEKVLWHNDIPINHERISKAKTIDWMSVSLNKTFPIIRADVSDCLKSGGKIRILVVNPNSNTPDVLARSGHFMADPEEVNRSIFKTLKQIQKWKKEIHLCNIEVRLLPSTPPYRITIIDRDLSEGYLYVRLPVFNDSKDIPMLAIHAHEKKSYDFFIQQYEMHWKHSVPIPNLLKFGKELGKILGENFDTPN